MDSQQIYPLAFSFECFPEQTQAGEARLFSACNKLAAVNPCFFSVTYGAGGSTRDHTLSAVARIKEKTAIDVAPHIAAIGARRDEIRVLLAHYKAQNIRHIVALRGDTPSGLRDFGDFNYASELVEFIRDEHGDYFFIEVAAHPETHPQAKSVLADLQNLKHKFDLGADAAITQYFYNPEAFFHFIDGCEKLGIDQPIIPGIMPITHYHQLLRFSNKCGVEIPRWMARRLASYRDGASIRAFGEEIVTRLCERLLKGGAAGLHFYTMNQADPALAIWNNLAISSDKQLRSRR